MRASPGRRSQLDPCPGGGLAQHGFLEQLPLEVGRRSSGSFSRILFAWTVQAPPICAGIPVSCGNPAERAASAWAALMRSRGCRRPKRFVVEVDCRAALAAIDELGPQADPECDSQRLSRELANWYSTVRSFLPAMMQPHRLRCHRRRSTGARGGCGASGYDFPQRTGRGGLPARWLDARRVDHDLVAGGWQRLVYPPERPEQRFFPSELIASVVHQDAKYGRGTVRGGPAQASGARLGGTDSMRSRYCQTSSASWRPSLSARAPASAIPITT